MNSNSNEFPWQAMLVVSILGLIGGFILYFTGCFNIRTYSELYTYISEYGLGLIFSLFFIGVAIYCWVLFFKNGILKPKKEVLFLLKIEDNVATFIDKKGKIFLFYNCKIDVGKYYYVLKTSDSIKEILNESFETFIVPKEKKVIG